MVLKIDFSDVKFKCYYLENEALPTPNFLYEIKSRLYGLHDSEGKNKGFYVSEKLQYIL